jgi:putative transposase
MTKRFTEEQIVTFLCEADAGVPVRTLCSKHGFSERSYNQWRSRIVGDKASLAQHLAHLQSENDELRQLLADVLLEATSSRAQAGFASASTGNDPCEPLLRVGAMAQVATRRLLGLRKSQPLQWPELMPLPESPSTDMVAKGNGRSEAGRDWAMPQREGLAASVCA